MTLKPKTPIDLALAPVAAGIDLNLQLLRDRPAATIVEQVALALNAGPAETRAGRAEQIVALAIRGVDLHGWAAAVGDDATRLHLSGGSVSLDLGLGARLRDYIDGRGD